MKHLFYGVAASALLLGTGGLAQACEKHASHALNAALEPPAAAAPATVGARGFVLAQSQDDAKEKEEGKEKSPDAVSPPVGPLAQSQDDSAREKGDEEKKPDMLPDRGFVLAQAQPDGQGGGGDADSKAKSDDK